METIMNEEIYLYHVDASTVKCPVASVIINEVVQTLRGMKTGKNPDE